MLTEYTHFYAPQQHVHSQKASNELARADLEALV